VWRISLPASSSVTQLAAWRAVLSDEEKRRADSFRLDPLAHDFLLAHAALRTVLGECLGISPGLVQFSSQLEGYAGGSTAKPKLIAVHGSGDPDLRFNLSHTHGAALIGVAIGRELGIDIEWQRPMNDLEGLACSVMSAEELTQWQALDSGDRPAAFYHLWTRKESYLKAIGQGLYHDLQAVTVPVSPRPMDPFSGECGLIRGPAGEGLWSVTDLPVPKGYSASICWEGAELPAFLVRDLDADALL